MLIKSTITSKTIIDFKFEFEDSSLNHSFSCKEGDAIHVKFHKDGSIIEKDGIISKIVTYQYAENHVIYLDTSTSYSSEVYNFPADHVLDMNISNEIIYYIGWQIDNNIRVIKNSTDLIGFLNIPYIRRFVGPVRLIIENNSTNNTLFIEDYNAITTNDNALFTWSLRDFSSIKKDVAGCEDLHYTVDGEYIYYNGDAANLVITALEQSNENIILAGTMLNIKIIYDNTYIIQKYYTVSEEDIILVTKNN